jgi:cell wall-associated NlpC family hydrolase
VRRTIPGSRKLVCALTVFLTVGFAGPTLAAKQMTKLDVLRAAKKGKTAPQILRQAFPGTSLVRSQEAPIRVLLVEEAPRFIIAGQSDLLLFETANPAATRTLPAGHRWEIKRVGSKYQVADVEDTAVKYLLTGPIMIDSGVSETGIRLADPLDHRYRGALGFYDGRLSTVSVFNQVDVENYLLGTLPGDMPPKWGTQAPAALRAGAIALRSRALAQRKNPSAYTDFFANDPLYLGLDGERTGTTNAVLRTKGMTLKRSGLPYPASFKYTAAMGSIAFQPRPGKPVMVALAGGATTVQGGTSAKAEAAVQLALTYVGMPYLWGGSSPSTGFDCSGLTWYVFGQQGIKLPRVAADQAKVGTPIPTIAELQRGDTVFFADSSGYIHHMGLYIGDGKMVHSPHTGDVIKISDITTGYYLRQFAGGRRYTK